MWVIKVLSEEFGDAWEDGDVIKRIRIVRLN